MGILYDIADVAEDIKLASILKTPDSIDAGETAAANFLTRAKFVTITLSGVGIAVFLALSGFAAISIHPATLPAPAQSLLRLAGDRGGALHVRQVTRVCQRGG